MRTPCAVVFNAHPSEIRGHADAFAQLCRDLGDPSTWPEDVQDILTCSRTLVYDERLHAVKFLIGNGAQGNVVRRILTAHARDVAAARHVNACIADAASGKYPHWTYFDVRAGARRTMGGEVADKNSPSGLLDVGEDERFRNALLGKS
tara:strand:- start:80 stop:523 length:444 start_codon:yes stop_codon:yes gene_type:complete